MLENGQGTKQPTGPVLGTSPVELRSDYIIHVQDKLLRIKKNPALAATSLTGTLKKKPEEEELEQEGNLSKIYL